MESATVIEPALVPETPLAAGAAAPDIATPGTTEPRAPQPGTAGPLVAVCSLCGGAGASTLAYLLALAVARMDRGPVLAGDTGGPTGGLATYAAAESPRSLPGLANAIAAHEPLADGLFVQADPGLRVLATRSRLEPEVDAGGLARLLADARDAHALTIVDCGTPGSPADLAVIAAATHLLWVLPASTSGLRRGTRVLDLFARDRLARELIVARRAEGEAPLEQLSALAAGRDAPLVLVPDVPDLLEQPLGRALAVAQPSLDAIAAVVLR